jgi:hypothetical protein
MTACGGGDSATTGSSFGSSGTNNNQASNGSSTTNTGSTNTTTTTDRAKASLPIASKGVFIDTIVEGMTVISLDKDGAEIGTSISDANGTYNIYVGAEQLKFKVGNLVIGQLSASRIVTVFEVFRGASVLDKKVQFLARVILSLDNDDNFDNGIKLVNLDKFNIYLEKYKATFDPLSQSSTVINTAMVNLGKEVTSKTTVTTAQAIKHLLETIKKLESKVSVTQASAKDCPYGGVAKTHEVDFNNDGKLESYTEVYCDKVTYNEQKTNRILQFGDLTCPYGGVATDHIQYNNGIEIAHFTSVDCSNDRNISKTLNTAKNKVPFEANATCPAGGIEEKVTLTEVTIASDGETFGDPRVVSTYSNIYCNAFDGNYTLVSSEIASRSDCPNGGIKQTFKQNSSEHKYSTITCASPKDSNYVTGDHNIRTDEANTTICPMGGTVTQHEVDYDNNGVFETSFSEVKCNEGNATVTLVKTTPLVAGENSVCPYGGSIKTYNATYTANGNVFSEYNTTTCDPVIVKETNTTTEANATVCPYGGTETTFTVKHNDVINHTYKTVECAKGIFNEANTSEYLLEQGKNLICPDGGYIVTTTQSINGKKIGDYNSTYCLPVIVSEENTTVSAPASVCPDGGEIVTHSVRRNGRIAYTFESVHCSKDIKITEQNATTSLEAGENTICPDGGKITTVSVSRNGNFAYDYNVTQCFNVVVEDKNISERDAGVVCPNGGKIVTTAQLRNGLIANTFESVYCEAGDKPVYTEANTSHKSLPAGEQTICPDGGDIYTTTLFKNGVPVSEYNSTICQGNIDISERNSSIVDASLVTCPDGGKVVTTEILRNGRKAYEYNSTYCDSTVKIVETNSSIMQLIAGANSICPDGGNIVTTSVTRNGNFAYDYNSTYCDKVVITEDNVSINAPIKICPAGGKIITVSQLRNGFKAFDYNVTQCNAGNGITESNTTTVLNFGSSICPDGGKIITTVATDSEGNVKYSYDAVYCEGNITVTERNASIVPLQAGGNTICPDGGYIAIVEVLRNGHKAYEYNTTKCDGVIITEQNATTSAGAECPWGGDIVTTSVYRNNAWAYDFRSVYCYGTTKPVETNVTVSAPASVCPWGGDIITRTATINGKFAYEYNSTVCKTAVFVETNETIDLIAGVSTICPDGGTKTIHTVKANDIFAYEYTTISCFADVKIQDKNTSIVLLVAGENDICPFGGKFITTTVSRNGAFAYDFNSTYCDVSKLVETNETLKDDGASSLSVCPTIGGIITVTEITNNGAFVDEYTSVKCNEVNQSK